MVNDQPAADLCGRVDLHAGAALGQLGKPPAQKAQMVGEAPVGPPGSTSPREVRYTARALPSRYGRRGRCAGTRLWFLLTAFLRLHTKSPPLNRSRGGHCSRFHSDFSLWPFRGRRGLPCARGRTSRTPRRVRFQPMTDALCRGSLRYSSRSTRIFHCSIILSFSEKGVKQENRRLVLFPTPQQHRRPGKL